LSHEMNDDAGAEAFVSVEGNMCGAVMRGPVALPGSEATSRTKGTRRNLGDLLPPTAAPAVVGWVGKLARASPIRKAGGVGRLHSTEEASNKADHTSAAESVEGRRPVEGKARSNACPGHSAGPGMSLKLRACGPEVNGPPKPRTPVAFDLRQEPGAGKPHAGICGGGVG
jgi:hypothetical protein